MTVPDLPATDRLAHDLLARVYAGTPPNVVLMHLLMAADSPEAARTVIARATRQAGNEPARRMVEAAGSLLQAHPAGWRAVHATAEAVDHEAPCSSPEAALAYWASAFDRLAQTAPEAGVALYALGSPELLASATAEIVDGLQGWSLIGPDKDVLDLGCGIGRFADALAPRVRSVLGLDLSGEMVAESRRRCARPNARFEQSSGRDLKVAETAGFDLVLAADVFPYLVQAGGTLVADHVREARRVLVSSGSLVILNFSYRGDPALDRSDIASLAQAYGFDAVRLGTQQFRLWDAAVFHLVKHDSGIHSRNAG